MTKLTSSYQRTRFQKISAAFTGSLLGLSLLGPLSAYALTVTEAKLNAEGKVEVSGTATPGAIVYWEQGPVARADSMGQFSFVNENLVPDECVGELKEGSTVMSVPLADCVPAQWQPQDMIVGFDDREVRAQAKEMRAAAKLTVDDNTVLDMKARRYADLKQGAKLLVKGGGAKIVHEYSHLPLMAVRVETRGMLEALKHQPGVVGVYKNGQNHLHLSQSLPLIGQPTVASVGATGFKTHVAVLDTGVDYLQPAFGNCAAGLGTSTCRVDYAQDFAPDDGKRDADGHGTNVAGIVVGVAPQTRIVALDVFNGKTASDIDIIHAINWVIANRDKFGDPIVAINLSLGSDSYAAECPSVPDPAMTNVFADARAAGIVPVVSSGNDGLTNSIAFPACVPGAVRVGAVYDVNVGGWSWGNPVVCTDKSTAADQVTCFSNSASFLTLLAPGAFISVPATLGSDIDNYHDDPWLNDGFITLGGTSQAAPHVAGAWAALKSAVPNASINAVLNALRSTGKPVTDAKSGVTTPRIALSAALDALESQHHFTIFTNDRKGHFGSRDDYLMDAGEWKLSRVNRDSKTDLVRYANGAFDFYLTQVTSTGNIQLPWSAHLSMDAGNWKLGDFNGDGIADLIRYVNGGFDIYLTTITATGEVRLSWAAHLPMKAGDWQLGDFNGDGKVDLVQYLYGAFSFYLASISSTGELQFSIGTGYYPMDAGHWKLGDFDGDGKADLIRYVNGAFDVYLTKISATGGVQLPWSAHLPMDEGNWELGKFNYDKKTDLIRYASGAFDILLSDGTGQFSWSMAQHHPIDSGVWQIGDFNKDGIDDIVRQVEGQFFDIYFTDGMGRISSWVRNEAAVGEWKVGDFNGDGYADIIRYVQ